MVILMPCLGSLLGVRVHWKPCRRRDSTELLLSRMKWAHKRMCDFSLLILVSGKNVCGSPPGRVVVGLQRVPLEL